MESPLRPPILPYAHLPQRAAADDAPWAPIDGDLSQRDEELRQLLLLLLHAPGAAASSAAPALYSPRWRRVPPAAAARPRGSGSTAGPSAAGGPAPPGALAAPASFAALARRAHVCGLRSRTWPPRASPSKPNWPRLSARARRTRSGRLGVSQSLLDDANCAGGTCPRCARHHRHHPGHCHVGPLSDRRWLEATENLPPYEEKNKKGTAELGSFISF